MEITYLGQSCFKIIGKKISILTDPYNQEMVGIKLPKQDVDVVTVSHQHSDHNCLDVLKGDYLLLDSAGEYEVKESEFVGVEGYHDDKQGAERGKVTMFSIVVDGIKVAHLGDIGTELTSAQLDCIDGVDILLIPVGGKYTIDAETAVKVVNQIDPKIVIPMHYQTSKISGLAPVTDFFKEMAVTPTPQEKLKVVLKDLPEELEVVYLKY
jgi:L-ascorbate metabolism protein UlaG (beta-lactamase superfamily)